MPFDPRDFLGVAETLAGAVSPTEAALRSAVSRTYYAVFLTARDRLRIQVEKDVHFAVINTFRKMNNGRHRAPADQLDHLRRLRTYADYEMDPQDPTRQDWSANYRNARVLANRLFPIVSGLAPPA
jgi:hypothetical protein